MQFKVGSEKEFIDFINNINSKDNIAILTHTDLDGIASAIFLEEILKSKNLSVKLLKFGDYKNDILSKLIPKLENNNISKLFILDLNIDSLAFEDFELLRKKINVFLIDHHPIDPRLTNHKNIIKSHSHNCATNVVNYLGKNFTDFNEKEWLLIPTMIAEFSHKDKENLKLIQKSFPNIDENNILKSEPSRLSEELSHSLIYYNDGLKKVYDLISKKDLVLIKKASEIIDKEIKNELNNLWKNAEFYDNKKLYIYYFKPKHRIKSMISNNASLEKPNYSFILITPEGKGNYLGASARNQSKTQDMNLLMKQATENLENANGGGHVAAAGARFLKKDLKKFKRNLLE